MARFGIERSEGLEKRGVKVYETNSCIRTQTLPEEGDIMILWLGPERTQALHALLLDVPLGGSALRLFNLVLSVFQYVGRRARGKLSLVAL